LRTIPPMLIDGTPLETPAPPLDDLLRVGLEAASDAVALVSAERSMSWHELQAETTRLAGGYRALGLEPGDRLASLMPNRIDLVVHYLACFKAGLIATPLNYRYTHHEIDHALKVSGARALLAHVERGEDLGQSRLAGELELGTVVYRDGAGAVADDGTWRHDFETLLMIASAASAFELEPGDAFLPGSSMSHIGSFLWALSTLAVGGRVVVARTTDSHELLPLLREQQPSVMAMIPAALSALVRDHDLLPSDLSCLRICRSGSDKVSTELLTEFAAAAGFPIVEGYGMTEVGLATLNPPSGVVKQGSIGPPIGGYSIAIRDEQGEPVGAEAVGRVWIRTRGRMSGYW
jgi:long-chain acyl-CoA synthetase